MGSGSEAPQREAPQREAQEVSEGKPPSEQRKRTRKHTQAQLDALKRGREKSLADPMPIFDPGIRDEHRRDACRARGTRSD